MTTKITGKPKDGVSPPRHTGQTDLCRICRGETFMLLNLRHHPFANALVSSPLEPVKIYPLALLICKQCSAAQLSYCADDKELYSHYNYITPDSQELKVHYGQIAAFLQENGYLSAGANVLEIGSNIGRFLEFIKPRVRSVLGVDPAANIAEMANCNGIPTVNDFFNSASAKKILEQQGKKDLIIARHCFAHNEKPWLMLEGVRTLISPRGVLAIENAYFLDTVTRGEFDQIYHEHMYYYNLRGILAMFNHYDLELVDVFHSPIHGGTMLYAAQLKSEGPTVNARVREYLEKEENMHKKEFYKGFIEQIQKNKHELNQLLEKLTSQGATIHAYGASAKSATLFNYYGINDDVVPYVVDSTVTKQGKYIPLVNIKIITEEEGRQNPPDYYLLTIWNYKDEIIKKVRSWGNTKTKFILPHPEVRIVE
ncbi:MAG TPA: hypothetical protein DD723_01565 [Candidatus Omnitrophica bacterium]|nr:hypothetical protein [Candidatus Omnitrophota bacterium]